MKSLAAKTPDRTPAGIFRRKLDLSRRLQDAADDHRTEGREDKYEFYHELATAAYRDAFAFRKTIA